MKKKVKITVPATVANLVCGFDILGMALTHPFDEMEFELIEEPKIIIKHIDEFGLSESAEENVAGVALNALLQKYPKQIGFKVTINKKIKPGSGLGSSAASAAGAAVGANYLINNFFTNEQLVAFAMEGEKLASGVAHADNVAPCIYGGLTLVRSLNPLDIISLNFPQLFVTVVHPQIEIKTSEARKILPTEISLKTAIKQWSNIAGLVAGFSTKDISLIARSLEDVIIEPIRSKLIPSFDLVKNNSKIIGALGGGVSGSGPSIFMFSETENIAKKLEEMMQDVYSKIGIDFKTYTTTINAEGIKIIDY